MLLIAGALPAARGDGDAVALVNGRPINKSDLVRMLIEAHGLDMLQQLVLLETARQESQRLGLRVTAADVDREYQDSLDELARKASMSAADATPANKLKALQTMLDEKHISLAEYMIAMERNAHLRKIAEKEMNITEETLRNEFARTYGERRLVRHIQVPVNDGKLLNEAVNRLNAGEDFASVARQLSKNPETAPRGGEMEPFSFDDSDIPAAMREAAFSLKEGGVSPPVRTELMMQILKLERIIPPSNVRYEEVRADVERGVRMRVMQKQMSTVAQELFKKAKVDVLDSGLKQKYDAFLKKTEGQP